MKMSTPYPEMITCTLRIDQVPVNALVTTGSTHSQEVQLGETGNCDRNEGRAGEVPGAKGGRNGSEQVSFGQFTGNRLPKEPPGQWRKNRGWCPYAAKLFSTSLLTTRSLWPHSALATLSDLSFFNLSLSDLGPPPLINKSWVFFCFGQKFHIK